MNNNELPIGFDRDRIILNIKNIHNKGRKINKNII